MSDLEAVPFGHFGIPAREEGVVFQSHINSGFLLKILVAKTASYKYLHAALIIFAV